MVHDKLGFEDDFMVYTSLPQELLHFIIKEKKWEKGNFNKLLFKRNELEKILNNDSKNLQFL